MVMFYELTIYIVLSAIPPICISLVETNIAKLGLLLQFCFKKLCSLPT